MATCFVIQQFDGGVFDKRYHDVFKPAIEGAGLKPYRVDQDPSVEIPIQDIERGIREATVCMAEITTDKPNVWFELGFAIAYSKPVVLVCASERTERFPFDIQHRAIVSYTTDSKQDFTKLEHEITERLKAILLKERRLVQVMSPVAETDGLSQHEMVALVSVAENLERPGGSVDVEVIRRDMDRAGFRRVATYLALAALVAKNLLVHEETEDWNGNASTVYRLSSEGSGWLMENQDRLLLWEKPASSPTPPEISPPSPDDDIPF